MVMSLPSRKSSVGCRVLGVPLVRRDQAGHGGVHIHRDETEDVERVVPPSWRGDVAVGRCERDAGRGTRGGREQSPAHAPTAPAVRVAQAPPSAVALRNSRRSKPLLGWFIAPSSGHRDRSACRLMAGSPGFRAVRPRRGPTGCGSSSTGRWSAGSRRRSHRSRWQRSRWSLDAGAGARVQRGCRCGESRVGAANAVVDDTGPRQDVVVAGQPDRWVGAGDRDGSCLRIEPRPAHGELEGERQ